MHYDNILVILAAMGKSQSKGLEPFLVQLAEVFFQLRRLGLKAGTISTQGGGTWSLLQLLATEGPKTVPQIAALRGVTRQHIQVTANELADMKLLRFADNPAHKRSKLLVITPKGKAHLLKMSERLRKEIAGLADDIAPAQFSQLTDTLRTLSVRLERRLGNFNSSEQGN